MCLDETEAITKGFPGWLLQMCGLSEVNRWRGMLIAQLDGNGFVLPQNIQLFPYLIKRGMAITRFFSRFPLLPLFPHRHSWTHPRWQQRQ